MGIGVRRQLQHRFQDQLAALAAEKLRHEETRAGAKQALAAADAAVQLVREELDATAQESELARQESERLQAVLDAERAQFTQQTAALQSDLDAARQESEEAAQVRQQQEAQGQ